MLGLKDVSAMNSYHPKKNLPFRPIKNLDFPSEVQIQTHTVCNARCIMCPYPFVYKQISHGRMVPGLFRRLIDECAHYANAIKDLKLFLMNEPLMDPRLPDFIRYARERLPKVNIGFSTNGLLLEGQIANELLDSGINEIWINFNGNKKETYETIMKGLSFERVKRNIISFKKHIDQKKLKIRLFISTVETKTVLNEIKDSSPFWAQYGIDVVTTPLNNRGGNLQSEKLKILKKIKNHRICNRPFYKMYITYNGNVILCSSDWKRETIIGNVIKEGIYGVWHNKNQKQIREWLLKQNLDKLSLCRNCDYTAIYK